MKFPNPEPVIKGIAILHYVVWSGDREPHDIMRGYLLDIATWLDSRGCPGAASELRKELGQEQQPMAGVP